MSTFSKEVLSGSTHGRGIKIGATAIGSGTTIHTAQASTTNEDLITLFAYNSDTVARTLTLGWGGTTSPDDLIVQSISPQAGLILVAEGLPLRNSLVITAAADAANVIITHGFVNRIS